MDALKAEISNKRKALEEATTSSEKPQKYLRRGDLERFKEEQERERLEKERQAEETRKAGEEQKKLEKAKAKAQAKKASSSSATPVDEQRHSESPAPPESLYNVSNDETIRRLRARGQPIRLFGESDKDRRLRLRALELIEEKGHDRLAGQNDFKKALEDVEKSEMELHSKDPKGKRRGDMTPVEQSVIDLDLIKTDPDKLYPLIYHALKRTLKDWEHAMDERPDHVKQTTQGKLAAATQVQSAEYLKPLFKQLRSRSLPADMLARIAEIVHHMQKRQYQRANDSYLRLSIGNAPWPIGVTMVGIHERSAREKISADQVAHVLNDEVSRKYIQSLKRLLTFSQTKYPPADISQLMG